MAQNLEYIYLLKDRYSKKLASITKRQLAFTETYRKSMGKVNAAAVAHGKIIARNTQLYNANKQAISRVKSSFGTLSQAQTKYTEGSIRKLTRLNTQWRKHGGIIRAQQARRIQAVTGRVAAGGKMPGGGLAGMAGGVGAGMVLSGIFGTAVDFETQLSGIKAAGQELSSVQLDTFRKKAMEWGISTEFSAVQVATAMREAKMTGMSYMEVLDSMPGNIALAAASGIQLADAMVMTTDVVNQFGLKQKDNIMVADLLAQAQANSTNKIVELGEALRNSGKMAKNTGLDVTQLSVALMALGETGDRGGAGGTFMANFMRDMGKMKPKLKKALQGIFAGTDSKLSDVFDLERREFTDFYKFIDVLRSNDNAKILLKDKFNIRSERAMLGLLGVSQEKWEKFKRVQMNSKDAALRMQQVMMEGLPGGLKLLNSALETSKLVMISSFIVPLSQAMRKMALFLVYISKNHAWVLKLTFVLLVLVTALTAVGIAAWITVGSMTSLSTVFVFLTTASLRANLAFRALALGQAILALATGKVKVAMVLLNLALYTNPIGLVIAGVAALAALFVYARYKTGSWTNAIKFMGGILIKSVLTPINQILTAFRGLFWLMSKIPGATGKAFGGAYDLTKDFQDKFNIGFTGNKSQTVLGMAYDLSQKGVGSSTWMREQERQEYVTDNTERKKAPTSFLGKMMSSYQAPAMSGYIPPEGINKKSATIEAMTKQTVSSKTDVTVKPIDIKGIIKIVTDKGVKVKDMSFTANTGGNMFTLGGAY